ncbi:MAG: hypothetical protein WAS05_09945 [Candidatus Nanopelagicales bacterium]
MAKPHDAYSAKADQQLDEFETNDRVLYGKLMDACEMIFDDQQLAQANSAALQTDLGIVMALPVRGAPGYRVFWTTKIPRVEAVFRYKSSDG